MSNIEPNIVDPTKPPDGPPPTIDPNQDGVVEPDDIKEPSTDAPPIEPDPEEQDRNVPVIRNRASQRDEF